jgi:dienelactone hydrolase
VLRSLPHETLPGVTFEYGSVTLSDGSQLRTILSLPEQRKEALPAVLLLQGGGCGSVDTPMAGPMAEPLRTVATHGFVTMRVDKSGVGDSKGPPCATIGYAQELEGYKAALTALRAHPSVDAGRIYLLGISLGGVFAPVLAGEGAVRAIIVFGTLVSAPSPYPGRSERFFREFAAVDVSAAWSAVDARVLALNGQFDEVAKEADHARIAALVNARHPGRASHQQLSGLDHCGTRHESMSRSTGNCGSGEVVSTLNDAVLAFLSSEPLLRSR